MPNIEARMSQLCTRLMSCAQQTLYEAGNIVEEMEYLAENNPDREDIKGCIADVKTKIKRGASEGWITAHAWGEHFDGVTTDTADDEADDETDEPDEEEPDDTDDQD